jgi:hypothetical protein
VVSPQPFPNSAQGREKLPVQQPTTGPNRYLGPGSLTGGGVGHLVSAPMGLFYTTFSASCQNMYNTMFTKLML